MVSIAELPLGANDYLERHFRCPRRALRASDDREEDAVDVRIAELPLGGTRAMIAEKVLRCPHRRAATR